MVVAAKLCSLVCTAARVSGEGRLRGLQGMKGRVLGACAERADRGRREWDGPCVKAAQVGVCPWIASG